MCAFMYQYSIFANNVIAVALVGVLRNRRPISQSFCCTSISQLFVRKINIFIRKTPPLIYLICLGITEDRNGQDGANSHQSTQDDKDAHTQHRDERIISCSPENLDSAQDSVGRFNNSTSVPRECKHDGVLLIVASVNVAFYLRARQGHMIDI